MEWSVLTGVGKSRGCETLLPCNVFAEMRWSALSRFRMRGWTQQALVSSVPVQPVQAVQPKLEKEKAGFSVLAEFF
jgi:hypothetical protein